MAVPDPEVEVLLCCARISRESERAAQLKELLREDLDWTYLLQAAHEHGIVPLLYWCLNANGPEAVPRTYLDQLRNRFYDNAQRNLFLTRELLRILSLFEAQGVLASPYKGPTLAALAYGNLALRQFGDLDILVHERDIPKAQELLMSLGYQQQRRLTGAQEAVFLHSGNRYLFDHSGGRSTVELHQSIARRYYSFRLDPNLWKRLEPITLGGSAVQTLSPEDLLLILCMHGCVHLWERLGWICDVAKLIHAHEGMEWGRIMEQAGKQGSERMLFLGLFLANDLLGATLPEKVQQKMQSDLIVKALAKEVQEGLFNEANGQRGVFGDTRFQTFHIRMRERRRDRSRYIVRTTLTPRYPDWMLLQLPTLLWPLYYLLRPVRLAVKHVRRLLGRF